MKYLTDFINVSYSKASRSPGLMKSKENCREIEKKGTFENRVLFSWGK